jgi:hypothetical protein
LSLGRRIPALRKLNVWYRFMPKLNSYVQLRYVLLVNVIAALVPAMDVKGRVNDPLLHASWWKVDQHSAVLVVALAAIVGSALVVAATRINLRKWWVFVGCGVLVGNFPAMFYLVAAPGDIFLPLADMYKSGTLCGVIAGIVLNLLVGRREHSAAAQ